MTASRLMSRRQVLAALKKAPKVSVWVNVTRMDGCYFLANKRDAKYRLETDCPGIVGDDEQVILAFTDEETGTLYIN